MSGNQARRYLPLIIMLAILLLAAAVRFHNLGTQSLWYDEGVAFGHSQRSLGEMIPLLRNNVHVPGYFGLLALWEDFIGSTEFGLRSLSAFWSVLSVALTFALGKRLFGPVAGIAAAGFVALNTFSITYAQEARMYAQLAAVAAGSMWILVGYLRAVDRGLDARRLLPWGVALTLGNTLGMYTHFSYALVMVAQGVLAVLWLGGLIFDARQAGLRPFLRAFVAYTLPNIVTVLAFLPWLETALSQTGAQPNISASISAQEFGRVLFGWLGVGITFEENVGGFGVVLAFLLVFGLITLPRGRRRAWWYLLVPVLWLLISVAGYWLLDLYTRYLRFLLPAQIALALWLGRGIWVLWHIRPRRSDAPILQAVPRFASIVAGIAVMIMLAGGLAPLYDDPAYQRDDYRGLAAQIATEEGTNDVILLSSPGLGEIFGYYYRGELPVVGVPTPRSDDNQIIEQTANAIAGHDRAYVLLYGNLEQDPRRLVEQTLHDDAFPINDIWWDDMRLLRYTNPATPPDLQSSGAQFGEHITLEAYAIVSENLQAGDALPIILEWRTETALDRRYKVFVQLLNEAGQLVTQRDTEPVAGLKPTIDWEPDTTITDRHALQLPDDLPPGEYRVIMGLYDANDASVRLPVESGDFLTLAEITVGGT